MGKPTYRIENIVATAEFGIKINLDRLAERIAGAEYNPEAFPGLIIRKHRSSVLLFSTGKAVITGSKSEEELERNVNELIAILEKNGVVIPEKPKVKVQNIVASGSLGYDVDIEKVALLVPGTFYEPEQFPGLIYRLDELHTVMLIFSSGKFVCTGARSKNEVEESIKKALKVLADVGALYEPGERFKTETEALG
ncbi:MAG: TATA-box-binding protein [Vulcanisaeta sp.]|nr:TATA-box-binding protein [Vulcanisaeta sp.]